MDALWESKIPKFENITVPAYIVASYSNMIHTPGTFRGWRRIASTDKWLRIHNTMEWPDYYEEANMNDLRRFFDHFLKDIDNGWQRTPRVRYAVLDLEGKDRTNQAAGEFPPEGVSDVKYYLNAAAHTLSVDAPSDRATASYDAESEEGRASFTVRVDSPTEFVGYPKVQLWVEADGSDDMDLFVFLQKLDADSQQLEQFNVPNHGPQMQALTRQGAAILKYKGSNGRLRVSLRHLDEASSTDTVPVHSFDHVQKLARGEIVCVDIDLFPIGLALTAGEQLRLVISGHHILGGVMPGVDNVPSENHGRHVIHTGDHHASYLQLPLKHDQRDP
jgi:hypothetical protein